jgi:hypothetical protein
LIKTLSLLFLYPEIASKWHPTLNGSKTPAQFTRGSNFKAFWTDNCAHIWYRSIKNQVNYKSCPKCILKVSAKTSAFTKAKKVGLLIDLNPNLASEWADRETDVNLISVRAYKRVRWCCSDCQYYWYAYVSERVNGRGRCPACNNKVLILGRNDLQTKYPEIADEMLIMDSSATLFNDRRRVSWSCKECCYVWSSSVSMRTMKNRQCPICFARSKTSVGQREVFNWLREIGELPLLNVAGFPNSRLELDIYLPAYNLGIEYNGDYWHSDRVVYSKFGISAKERHSVKDQICHANGVNLIVIWESDWYQQKDLIKKAIIKVYSQKIIDPVLAKTTLDEGSLKVKTLNLVSTICLRPRALRPEEREIIKERYLEGESYCSLAKELNLSKHLVGIFVNENKLIDRRRELGIDARGNRTLPTQLTQEFIRDWHILKRKSELLSKYSISSKKLKKLEHEFFLDKKIAGQASR